MTRHVRSPVVAVAALAVLASSQGVPAYEVQTNWVGNEVHWEDEDLPAEWELEADNAPVGGGRWNAVQQAIDEWNRTGGIRLLFTSTAVPAGGTPESQSGIQEGDGRNQIRFVDRAVIDGVAGRERTTFNCGGCRRIVESDVRIANDITTNAAQAFDRFGGCNAQTVIIHELGHSIGLDHESGRLAIMQPSCNDTARVPGHPGGYMVMPDDQQGARQHHAGGGDEVNLFASAQFLRTDLPQPYRDRYDRLREFDIVDDPTGNDRLVNFGNANTDKAFNPDWFACILFGGFDPGCQPITYDVAGDPLAINLCPAAQFDVPFTVGNRANSAGTEKLHSIGFYLSEDTDQPPFDPTDQFPDAPPLAGAIVDNEIEFDSTGALVATQVRTLTLSDDPDCAPEGEYRLWHGVDICHERLEGNGSVQAGGILEDDNFVLTGLRINILAPGAPACAGLGLPVSDGVCPVTEIRKTCTAPPVEPPGDGGPPTDCDPGEEDCICVATIGRLGDEDGHPDGDHAIGEFCPDDGDIQRTCVSQGSFGLCTTCNEGGDRHVGCNCTEDDQCSTGLTCWGEETQNGGGTGRCYPEDEGPPSWVCAADCGTLFNSDAAFCYNDHPSGEAMCLDGACGAPQATQCWQSGVLEGIDDQPTTGPVCRFAPDDSPLSASCRSECGPGADLDNPGVDVTCQDIGYPPTYECDLMVAGGACRRGPL